MTGLLATNLKNPPYGDTFDQAKQYYRALFKPATALQAQEGQFIFSYFQDQIDKFGRNIYKSGSIVEGCQFAYDPSSLYYVKIADAYTNSVTLNVNDFKDLYAWNQNGLKALVREVSEGAITLAPNTNTLYVKYLNKGTYGNGALQSSFDASDTLSIRTEANALIGTTTVASNVSSANVGNPSGLCYAMHINEGVIFHKGCFIYVQPQTVIVSKYDNVPNQVSVGFGSTETIVTADIDPELFDNADGSPNYGAPGADRLKIVPSLVVKTYNEAAEDETFFSLVDFVNGTVVKQKQDEQLSTLGIELARRTYETNGDFVVKPFILATAPISNTANTLFTTHQNLTVDRGLGYAKGYRVEYLNKDYAPIRKGTDYNTVESQIVSANFGNYVVAKELAGQFLSSNGIVQVELHNVTKTAVSSGSLLGVAYSSTTKIGTAYVRGIAASDLDVNAATNEYKLYLFNVEMSPGQNFASVKSIINYNSGVLGVADVVLDFSYTANSYIAQIQEPSNPTLVYPFGQQAIKIDGFNNTQYEYKTKASTSFQANGSASISIGAAAGTGTEGFPYLGLLDAVQKGDIIVVPTAQGLSANNTANVATTAGSNVVVGTGTAFASQYAVGDWIAVYTSGTPEVRLITGIANNTYLTTATTFTTANTSTRHAIGFPVGMPIPLTNRSGRTVNITSSTAGRIDLGVTMQGAFNVDYVYSILRAETVPSKKQIKRNIFVKIDCSNNAGQQYGPWCLGLPDVFQLEGVYVGSGGSYSNSGTNMKDSFTLDNGQRDAHYGLSYLRPKSGSLAANSSILVQLSHFTYDVSQGVGFFTGNSYPIDDANTANSIAIQTAQIPVYVSSRGMTYDLRDSVDYRPRASNTAVSSNTVGGASINPSSVLTFSGNPYLPNPDSNFQTDLQFYLTRKDRVSMDTDGNIIVTEGLPVPFNPQPPDELPNAMTLGIMTVPPYPSLSTPEARLYNRFDYAITSTLLQNRRYTMRDIGVIDQRVSNLEYISSLTLLEVAAQQLLVRNNDTGQNRFRTGIFVDPFAGFDISNVNDPNFAIAIDDARTEIRPRFNVKRTDLDFDATNSTGCGLFGELIMLNHTANNLYISQPSASKYRNCIDGNVFEWKGTIVLDPPGTLTPDLAHSPDVVNNLDLASNWIALGQSAWGTQWGSWVDTAQSTNTSSSTSSSGNYTTTTTTTTTTTQQKRTALDLDVTTRQNQMNLGTFVTNISILPYLKPALIRFTAHGLKPNTRVYAYFNSVAVSAACAPRASDFSATGTPGDIHSGIYGDPLKTDATGSCYGWFYIPANTFKQAECVFRLTDISDLAQGADAITTDAQATFYGSLLSFSTASSILNTRDAVLQFNELQEQRTLQGSSTFVSTVYIPPPAPPPPTYYDYYWEGGGGGTGSGPGGGVDGACGCGDAGGSGDGSDGF